MTVQLINDNPMLKNPSLVVLTILDGSESLDRAQLEAAASEQWEASWHFTPSGTVDALIRGGIVDERVFVNDEPYEGSYDDLMVDESIPLDATAKAEISLLEEGVEILREYAPQFMIEQLFSSKPEYQPVFTAVLGACAGDAGASLPDLEKMMKAMPQLQPDTATKQTKVYPQYFIDALETAGGIAWRDGWRITEAGAEALEGLCDT